MARPRICAAIVSGDAAAAKRVAPLVDLYELRLDLIGGGWPELVPQLEKPWIACNRKADEGGRWAGSEAARTAELLRAVELGAPMVDIELSTPGLAALVGEVGGRAACLLSHHDLSATPPLEKLREIVNAQRAAGAAVCKVVTTARRPADNVTVLQLIRDFPGTKVVAFAMGAAGHLSRVLCPLVGGDFTYAAAGEGQESAPGQLAAQEMRDIYGMLA